MTEENEFSRGMVVVAHADDAEFGCSGTVARLCADGFEMVYVMCTDGSKGTSDPAISSEKLAKIRRQEQINAGKELGLKKVEFLDYPDGYLQPTLELRKDIARQIRRYKPDILICQYPMRTLDGFWGVGHPDHMAAGEAALSAVFPTARDHLTFPELFYDEGLETHKVAEVWIMGHPNPDHYVDVSESLGTAVKAVMKHESQMSGRDEAFMTERLQTGRRETAKGKGMQYAEAFKKITMRR
jgi:LmbE family N-acetylglucosaminyl deacetylase